jgi:hypothetical protein
LIATCMLTEFSALWIPLYANQGLLKSRAYKFANKLIKYHKPHFLPAVKVRLDPLFSAIEDSQAVQWTVLQYIIIRPRKSFTHCFVNPSIIGNPQSSQ